MQRRPDQGAMLRAVAKFLESEVRPKLKSDASLSFRALVASSLCQLVAAELDLEDGAEGAELDRLVTLGLSKDPDRTTKEARRRAVRTANKALSARIRAGEIANEEERERIWEHVQLTLRGELLMASPRFDTSLEIE
jgi:hypothetical protein